MVGRGQATLTGYLREHLMLGHDGDDAKRPRGWVPYKRKARALARAAAAPAIAEALFALSGFRTLLHPLQPAQKQANVLRQFLRCEIARRLTQ